MSWSGGRWCLCCVLFALAAFFSIAGMLPLAVGQGVLIDESGGSSGRFSLPRPQATRPSPPQASYAITEFSVNAAVNSQIAVTQVTQVFKNTGSTQLEARFVFPLPYEGAVDQMTFLVDGKE